MKSHLPSVHLPIPGAFFLTMGSYVKRHIKVFLTLLLTAVSVYYYWHNLANGLGLSYNDARSHLDIGRRVVEGLKPGLAQLGSVWLPLNHLLMVPIIWNDWAWHSGFAGALWNMISFIGCGLVIYTLLERLRVGLFGRIIGVLSFMANINVLYLQSTAMTEIILLFTMTMGCYYLLVWHEEDTILDLIKAAFWIMLATLVRYDGWFLLGMAGLLVMRQVWARYYGKLSLKALWFRMEGVTILFAFLAMLGIGGWLLWNYLIFDDALYFALGPFSARAQQLVMEAAGALPTKHNLLLSIQVYAYSFLYNTYTYPALIAFIGYGVMWRDRALSHYTKWALTSLWAPLLFNILALYLGFSVIYVQGISGNTWFNIRYGIMLMPTVAICIGYLVDRAKAFRWVITGSLIFVLFFAFANQDAVAIDDARVGSSQKNVSEVSGYLATHANAQKGFILISAASHDAIIFSSGLPMKRYIHEGTGLYWEHATTMPDRWAKWIVMRTYDDSDLTWKAVSKTEGFKYYTKVAAYPFADIYELHASMSATLTTSATLGKQK
jgi:hypothetical protein